MIKPNRLLDDNYSFEDLKVYQKAYQLSLDIHRISLGLPKIEQFAIADQIRRASKSICANIAEGFGKQGQSKLEFKRFLTMAIGSSDEMKVWLNYCRDLGYLSVEDTQHLKDTYIVVSKMLNNMISAVVKTAQH